jgi:predicted nucleic acid-binding protein
LNFTIDASVIVSLARASEETHAASFEFLREVRRQDAKLFCPSIVLAECSATIARQTDNPSLAQRIFSLIEALPNLSLIDIDSAIARRAAAIVTDQHLKAYDAIYVAVAESQDAVLITWDAELIEHGNEVLDVITPVAWLEQQNNTD